jgi:hypothetical protein
MPDIIENYIKADPHETVADPIDGPSPIISQNRGLEEEIRKTHKTREKRRMKKCGTKAYSAENYPFLTSRSTGSNG